MSGSIGVGTVFAMAFIVGSMTTLFDAALYAMIPSLVPKERYSDANSFVTASIQANFALGPLIGGLLAFVFAGPEVGLFLNGATFVISAWTLRYVGRVAHHTDVTAATTLVHDRIRGGHAPDLGGATSPDLDDLVGHPELRRWFRRGHLHSPLHGGDRHQQRDPDRDPPLLHGHRRG